MKMSVLALILLSFIITSCSGSKKEAAQAEEAVAVEEVVSDELAANSEIIDEEEFVDEDEIIDDEEIASGQMKEVVENVSMKNNGDMKTYTVKENETLMMIAFKVYGDYKKWREIARDNQDVLRNGKALSKGMVIKYAEPEEDFAWSPDGDPYLIKWGDTLGKISDNVYGTQTKWKHIWQNNKPLIRDPNKIYAGFTIYYLSDLKDVALK